MIERDVVRAIPLDEQRRVLLGLRSRGHSAGKWSLFGGKVDPGETYLGAVRREFVEETGTEFIDVKAIFDGKPIRDYDEDGKGAWNTYYFTGRVLGNLALHHSEQQSRAASFAREDLSRIEIAFGHAAVLEAYYDLLS